MLPVHEIIAGHPFLVGMPNRLQEILTANACRTQFHTNEVIFREGDEANTFYLLGAGSVALYAYASGHPRIVMQILHEGDVLGWSWLFPPYRWHLSARALEETQAVVVHVEKLRQLCATDPELACDLLKRFAEVIVKRLQAARLRFFDPYVLSDEAEIHRLYPSVASVPL
jgi:CRP/FNR family transcriptional regulator, cyclic AMP receptor protein